MDMIADSVDPDKLRGHDPRRSFDGATDQADRREALAIRGRLRHRSRALN